MVRVRDPRRLGELVTSGRYPYRGHATYQSVGRSQTSVRRWCVLGLGVALVQEAHTQHCLRHNSTRAEGPFAESISLG